MAIQRVVVEIDLGVEADEFAVLGHHQRIDFQQAHILGDKGVVETLDHRADLLGLIILEAQRRCDFIADEGRIAGHRLDLEGLDLFRRVMRHGFNVHAAFGGNDEGDAAGFTVHQCRQIQFAFDGRTVFNIKPLDQTAMRAGLMCHQGHAQHAPGFFLHILDGLHHLDTAALAAAAGMDLGLHHPDRAGQGLGGGNRLFHREGGLATGHGRAEAAQDLFCLIFVYIHGVTPWNAAKRG